MYRKENSFFEYLDLFASLFMIFLLVLVLIYSIIFWVDNFPYGLEVSAQYFYAGVGIAIMTSIGQWLSGRLESINKNVKNIFNIRRKNARRKS